MTERTPRVSDDLRKAIRSSPISRYRIFKLTGIDQAALSRFLNKRSGISLETVDRLAAVLRLRLVARTTQNNGPLLRRGKAAKLHTKGRRGTNGPGLQDQRRPPGQARAKR